MVRNCDAKKGKRKKSFYLSVEVFRAAVLLEDNEVSKQIVNENKCITKKSPANWHQLLLIVPQ